MTRDLRFIDQFPVPSPEQDLWPEIVIPKGSIDAEIEPPGESAASGQQAAALDHRRTRAPSGGKRACHRIKGCADVLLPGRADPCPTGRLDRRSTYVIRGRRPSIGAASARSESIRCLEYASHAIYWHGNDSTDIQARLHLLERCAART